MRRFNLWLFLAASVFAGAASAQTLTVSSSHIFVNYFQLDDGFEFAEYEFTITNNSGIELYDLRFSFGLNAPEPIGPEGDSTLRIEVLAPGESSVAYWTMTVVGAPSELLSESDLNGWVEAVDTVSGEIISLALTSVAQGGAQ